MVKPAGPLSVLPSADVPSFSDLARATIASRSFAHSASQPSIEVGCAAGAAVVVAPPDAVELVALDVLEEVSAELFDESSPPHAAATIPRAATTDTTARIRVLITRPPVCDVRLSVGSCGGRPPPSSLGPGATQVGCAPMALRRPASARIPPRDD